jgi:acyl-CoA thioester hydrolase
VQSIPGTPPPSFDFPNPHLIELSVLPEDIDEYQHVNNSVYLRWLDRVAWSHSAALGLPMEECIGMRRGMAAIRTEIDYLLAALGGDRVWVATWITRTDHRLRVERRFQVGRAADPATLARARTEYVCINLDNGRAARMPEPFARLYTTTAAL